MAKSSGGGAQIIVGLSTSAVARGIKVSPRTLLRWEELGLVPAARRTASGRRIYDSEIVRAIHDVAGHRRDLVVARVPS